MRSQEIERMSSKRVVPAAHLRRRRCARHHQYPWEPPTTGPADGAADGGAGPGVEVVRGRAGGGCSRHHRPTCRAFPTTRQPQMAAAVKGSAKAGERKEFRPTRGRASPAQPGEPFLPTESYSGLHQRGRGDQIPSPNKCLFFFIVVYLGRSAV